MFLVDAIIAGVLEFSTLTPAIQIQFDVTQVPDGAKIVAIAGVHSSSGFASVQTGWYKESEVNRAGVKVGVYSRIKNAADSVVYLETTEVPDYSLEGVAVAFHDTSNAIAAPVIRHTGEEHISLYFDDFCTDPYLSEQEVGEVNSSNLILKAVFAKPDVMYTSYAADVWQLDPAFAYQPTEQENLTFSYGLTRQNLPGAGSGYNYRFGGVWLKYTSQAVTRKTRR